jgi:hypothetical protein
VGERRYPKTLRDELVRLARAGTRIEDLSRRFGPDASLIRRWLRADRAGVPAGQWGLAVTHPALAADLDPHRNPDVDPAVVTARSRRKVWWRCAQGHLWEAKVHTRAEGSGCPVCAGRHIAGIAVTHPGLAAQLAPTATPASTRPP